MRVSVEMMAAKSCLDDDRDARPRVGSNTRTQSGARVRSEVPMSTRITAFHDHFAVFISALIDLLTGSRSVLSPVLPAISPLGTQIRAYRPADKDACVEIYNENEPVRFPDGVVTVTAHNPVGRRAPPAPLQS